MDTQTRTRKPRVERIPPAEQSLRGKIAVSTALGRDVRPLRAKFDALQATRILGEAADRLVKARAKLGLSPTITDPVVLDKIAALIDNASS